MRNIVLLGLVVIIIIVISGCSVVEPTSGNNWGIVSVTSNISQHSTSHGSGGIDVIKLDDLGTTDDNTDLNATATEHGLLPKLNNNDNSFLNGQGQWSVPVNSESGEGHIILLPLNYDSIGQGSWSFSLTASQWLYGYMNNSSSNDGDSLTYKAFLASGNYTMALFSITSAGRGIMDIDIEGSEVASFDLYSGGLTYMVRKTESNIIINDAGVKDIVVRVDGKNASSAGYTISISYIALWRDS